jgi:hypothetical protein
MRLEAKRATVQDDSNLQLETARDNSGPPDREARVRDVRKKILYLRSLYAKPAKKPKLEQDR